MEKDLPSIKEWVVLYPVYINSKKTVAQGRRIAVEKACENPTCAEIGDCLSYYKVPFAIEIDKVDRNKYVAYPRDSFQIGRLRVLLKKEYGTLFNPAIATRKQLMLKVAELVPRHPGRTKKQEPPAGSSKSRMHGKKKR